MGSLDTRITVRLTAEERALLAGMAKAERIEAAVLARRYIRQGLGQFDPQLEAVTRRLDHLVELVTKCARLSGGAFAAAAVLKAPVKGEVSKTQEEGIQALRKHLLDSLELGRWLEQQVGPSGPAESK